MQTLYNQQDATLDSDEVERHLFDWCVGQQLRVEAWQQELWPSAAAGPPPGEAELPHPPPLSGLDPAPAADYSSPPIPAHLFHSILRIFSEIRQHPQTSAPAADYSSPPIPEHLFTLSLLHVQESGSALRQLLQQLTILPLQFLHISLPSASFEFFQKSGSTRKHLLQQLTSLSLQLLHISSPSESVVSIQKSGSTLRHLLQQLCILSVQFLHIYLHSACLVSIQKSGRTSDICSSS